MLFNDVLHIMFRHKHSEASAAGGSCKNHQSWRTQLCKEFYSFSSLWLTGCSKSGHALTHAISSVVPYTFNPIVPLDLFLSIHDLFINCCPSLPQKMEWDEVCWHHIVFVQYSFSYLVKNSKWCGENVAYSCNFLMLSKSRAFYCYYYKVLQ